MAKDSKASEVASIISDDSLYLMNGPAVNSPQYFATSDGNATGPFTPAQANAVAALKNAKALEAIANALGGIMLAAERIANKIED